MSIIEKTLRLLNKESHVSDGLNIITLIEQEPLALEKMSEILRVPFVTSKEEFEEYYMASFAQELKETDAAYQQRLIRLNEFKLLPAISKKTQKKIIFCIDPSSEELEKYCNWEYGLMSLSTYKDIIGLKSTLSISFDENEEMPVFIKKLFKYCHENKATDINLTAMQSTLSVTAKISGEWTNPIGSLPIIYKNKFLISLCSLANPTPVDYKSGKATKFRVPQDIDGINLLFRIAIFPSTFGEDINIRKLPTVGTLPNLHLLGLSNEGIEFLNKIVKMINSTKKGGMVLITGETGSGKSTLLSAVISEYLKLNKKVNTSEDPVENKHPHPFLNQTDVGEDTGLSHMDALKAFLRATCDVIVIGECRESSEIEAVINASLTGNFTYTTYHTGSVEFTLMRLQSMNIDLNLIAGTLKAIISTNLIPMLCNDCKIELKEHEGRYIRNHNSKCPTCKGRGINGVIPVIEAAPITKKIKKMIGNCSINEIMHEIEILPDYISFESQIIRLKELGLIDNDVQNEVEDWATTDA